MKFFLIFIIIFNFVLNIADSFENTWTNGVCESLLLETEGIYIENAGEYLIEHKQKKDGTYRVIARGRSVFWFTKGFVLQARPADNPNDLRTFGFFVDKSLDTEVSSCFNPFDTASHNTTQGTFNFSWEVVWWPPKDNKTTIVFT